MGAYVDALSILLCSRTFCGRSNEGIEIGNHTRVAVLKILVLTFDKSMVMDLFFRFATLDKARPVTGNTKGLNLAAVKHTTVQVSKTAVVAKATSSRV
jgi:hypothetical protein